MMKDGEQPVIQDIPEEPGTIESLDSEGTDDSPEIDVTVEPLSSKQDIQAVGSGTQESVCIECHDNEVSPMEGVEDTAEDVVVAEVEAEYVEEEEEPEQADDVEPQSISDIEVQLERSETAEEDVPQIESISQAKHILEALLFAATEPLSLTRIEKITGLNRRTLRGLVLQLQMEYYRNGGGLQVIEVAGGYQMATCPEYHHWIARLRIGKSRTKGTLTVSVLETLAIIAYKQPITKADIDSIRGVDSSGTMKKLVEARLVRVVGRKPPPQRSYLYGTTKDFLLMFGLKNIKDLPSLPELKELMGIKIR